MVLFTVILSILSPFIAFLMLVLNRRWGIDVNPDFVFYGTLIVVNSIAIQLIVHEKILGQNRKG